jgi:RNA polymerase sigma factor (sigma-70 family)
MTSSVMLEIEDGEASTPVNGRTDVLEPWLTRRASLLRLCLRWTGGNHSDAEDLLGDACLRAMEARGDTEIRSPVSFSATIIANLARDRRRLGRCRRLESLGLESHPGLVSRGSWPDDLAHAREVLARAISVLERVPARQRSALLLRSLGEDYSRIADQVGTTRQSARKLVQFARAAVQTSE